MCLESPNRARSLNHLAEEFEYSRLWIKEELRFVVRSDELSEQGLKRVRLEGLRRAQKR